MASRAPGPAPRGPALLKLERRLRQAGFDRIAGADEAGRGACAGPLVVGACILPAGRAGAIAELADSKLLTPAARDRVYDRVVRRAEAWSVVVIDAADVDRIGLHVANVMGMRRALARLDPAPAYALTDGFPVRGLGVPGLAVWKGDRVSANVAAASVLAKVTRDRIMTALAARFPAYGFEVHKGYVTPAHAAALEAYGPCAEHRRSYVNVRRALAGPALSDDGLVTDASMDPLVGVAGEPAGCDPAADESVVA
ncbi:MAG TPA: ribonuclease HII [Mycobacteriales bacterium]